MSSDLHCSLAFACIVTPIIFPLPIFSLHPATFPLASLLLSSRSFGVQLNTRALPYLQLGPVPYKTFSFLAYSLKSLSLARRYTLKSLSLARRYTVDGLADQSAMGELPLWHSAIFKKSNHLTYYCLRLIRKGVLQVKDLFNSAHGIQADLLCLIGPTWRAVYASAVTALSTIPATDWSIPAVWVEAWAKSATLKRLAANLQTETRRSPAVWKAFWRAQLPPSVTDFVHWVLWYKLKTAERLSPWTKYSQSPVCGALEMVEHKMSFSHSCF